MKKNHTNTLLYISVTVISLLFAGCSDNIFDEASRQHGEDRIQLSGDIDQLAVTRVNDNGFCDGDVMGVYIVDYEGGTPGTLKVSGNRGDNVRHTFDEPNYKWNSAYDLFWKDKHTHIDVYGYYPFANPESIDDYQFEVQRDQNRVSENGNMGGYEASDFLWGKVADVAPTTSVIRLPMKHRMSNACVTLVQGDGFANGEWANTEKIVLTTNVARKASINMADGNVSVAGGVEQTATIPSRVGDEWRTIVVPQTVNAGTTLFSITIGGVPYKFTKNENLTYISGKMMKFSIRVDKKAGSGKYSLTLISESITPWENDLVSHDATAKEYVIVNPTAGHLKDSIAASHKDFTKVKRMKVTGTINAYDFVFMRDSMPKLTALNLKNVRIKGLNVKTDFIGYMVGGIMYHDGEAKDDVLPPYCLGDKKTLTSVVLPDVLKRIERSAFTRSGLKGSLNIPEGVVEIGDNAFLDNDFTGVLALPSTLKKIDSGAFANAAFICPLNLPDGIEELGSSCFYNCRYMYGNLILPSHLKKLGSGAFRGCTGLKGDLVIPKSLTRISWQAFESCGLGGRLQLHDGITVIGENTFSNNGFIGELELPKSLTKLYGGNFEGNNFSGSFKIPKGLTSISDGAFSYCTFEGEMEIPDGIMCIHKRTFYNSKNLQKIILPSELELIEEAAFQGCKSLRVIECKSPVPPLVISTAFDGVPLEDLTIIVPKSALNDYKSSESWSGFKHIIAK